MIRLKIPFTIPCCNVLHYRRKHSNTNNSHANHDEQITPNIVHTHSGYFLLLWNEVAELTKLAIGNDTFYTYADPKHKVTEDDYHCKINRLFIRFANLGAFSIHSIWPEIVKTVICINNAWHSTCRILKSIRGQMSRSTLDSYL
jgi:hypothetical protein